MVSSNYRVVREMWEVRIDVSIKNVVRLVFYFK